MSMVPLGEIVDFYSGGTPSKAVPEYWRGDVPWFSAKDMKRPRLSDSIDHMSEDVFSRTSLRRLPAGTIAIVVRGMILAHTVPISILDVDAAINQDIKALIPKREVDATYLAAMLRAQHAEILSKVSTAAHGTKKIETHVLAELPVPLPALDKQRRIAAILDHAAHIVGSRQRVAGEYDVLAQSLFATLVGGLPSRLSLRDIGMDFISGKNVLATAMDKHAVHRIIKVSAISSGSFKPSESKPMPAQYHPPEAHRLRRGDVLFGRASGSLDLLGATAVVDVDPVNLFLPDKVWRMTLTAKSSVLPAVALALLRSETTRGYIRHNASGAAGVRNIRKSRLLEHVVPLPAPSDQVSFAERMEVVERQRSIAVHAADRAEALLASLQARAFAGEL